jgi:rRNA-processing protein FCF1
MTSSVYVLDTHALIWFVKGTISQFGFDAFVSLIHPRARIVIPAHVFVEAEQKFTPKMASKKTAIRLPPTPLLRLVSKASNVRILPRGPTALAYEFRLRRNIRVTAIDHQDIPIAAAVLACREHYRGPVALITNDGELTKWAISMDVPVIWNRRFLRLLPA